MDTKKCGSCGQIKSVYEFNKNKRQKDGFQTMCKVCQKEYNQQNKETLKQYYQDWFSKTKLVRYQYNKEHRKNNIEKYKEYNKKYRSKSTYKEKRRKYETQLRQESLIFRVKCNLRKRIGSFLTNKKYTKNKSTEKLLGCSYTEFIVYLEGKFKSGMNWENYGMYGWHIDHIIPLASAKNQEELEKLCHYTNLQPLWAAENLSKGDKLISF